MMKRSSFLNLSLACLASGLSGCASWGAPRAKASSHFTLWQLPSQGPSQMMSYVLQTGGGKVVVIDGGRPVDAPYLRGFIDALGGEVEAWFITHIHDDHHDALAQILKRPAGLRIKAVYGSTPDEAWLAKAVVPESEKKSFREYVQTLQASGVPAVELTLGQQMDIDGVSIEVLAVKNPELMNGINNQSLVLRVADAGKVVLFLGDLGPEAGDKLLHGPHATRLRADIVQMAHHGQAGVRRNVYEAIRPTVCLWPAPRWLYDNDTGKGPGSGPLQTLEVRQWMKELGVTQHKVMADGLVRID